VASFLFNIENLVLGARSEYSGFAGKDANSLGVLEWWSTGVLVKMKARISFELVFSLLHYSTTPSLQQTAARGKEHASPLKGQSKAGYFGSGFFIPSF
jgi:hypothetical protein